MSDEKTIREKARAALRSGKLPNRAPDRSWGGPGVGAVCVVCNLPVTKGEMEFEIQFAHDGGNPGLDNFHVHIRCFAAWEFERRGGELAHDPWVALTALSLEDSKAHGDALPCRTL